MDLTRLLDQSSADDAFKRDVLSFAARGHAERIELARYNPPVKVMRLLAQLLVAEPRLTIERVCIDAWSGCADYGGTVAVEVAGRLHHYEFHWDCRWRAEQEGWTDFLGLPDQIRAAREFGWRCFARWQPIAASAALA
jgi:hypothetical protein